ncbi:histidine--tRNA ligase [Altericista sp. CCNU0014]|uniref:histidine--tRNA ligase n=1 Tax=Altericista sp. CCNU0014 TaxID=3082949 RepID=UPI0038508597
MGLIQASRGTRDILPDEVAYWQQIEATARDLLHRAAYRELRTPIFEQTDLFERGIGEATDVVGKEMYTFLDRGDRSVTLRPEGTAGAVRAYIEHKLHAQGGVQRLWYVGPMFRYERPQAGRQRQFHQLGVEAIGSADPRADVEAIALAADILRAVGIQDWTLSLNSIGTKADRQHYRDALVAYLQPYANELDADSKDRLTRNPLRILDSKDEKTLAIAKGAPSILDYLSAPSSAHFERVRDLLQRLKIPFAIDPCLVRGLDYYTHTAFEFKVDALGAQSTVCGGGRYDGLISELGGPDTPAVGWAIGLERLVLTMQQQSESLPAGADIYCAARGADAEAQALEIAQRLRQAGLAVEVDLSGSAFGKQLKRADRSGAPLSLILGEEEAVNATVQLKWLASGEQATLRQFELFEQISLLQEKIMLSKPAKRI